MTTVSILTAALVRPDHYDWLRAALRSVAEQQFADIEHIVVDDGSPKELAAHFRKEFPRVKWLRNYKSVGPGASRNMAATMATGDYIFCLDADDVLYPNAIRDLYAFAGPCKYVYGDLLMDNGGTLTKGTLPNFDFEHLRRMVGPVGVSALQPRTLWATLGGWNEYLPGLEDIEYWIRAAERGICGERIDSLIMNYRQHDESRTAQIYNKDKPTVQGIRKAIQQAHHKFMEGTIVPNCAKCPPHDPSLVAPAVGAASGEASLKYVGGKLGSFHTPRGPSGKSYLVEGKGAWVHIDPRDVEHLLQYGSANGPDYIRVGVQSESNPLTEQVPMLPPMNITVPNLAQMKPSEATAFINGSTDKSLLRVLLAQEQASAQPREQIVRIAMSRIVGLQ